MATLWFVYIAKQTRAHTHTHTHTHTFNKTCRRESWSLLLYFSVGMFDYVYFVVCFLCKSKKHVLRIHAVAHLQDLIEVEHVCKCNTTNMQ